MPQSERRLGKVVHSQQGILDHVGSLEARAVEAFFQEQVSIHSCSGILLFHSVPWCIDMNVTVMP